MTSKRLVVFASLCVGVVLCQTEAILDFPQVEIPNGMRIVGQTNHFAQSFYSIPYAQPPVGDLRFMPPVPLEPKEFVNASTPDYVSCWQLDSALGLEGQMNLTEDCLVLSVHAPSASKLAGDWSLRPVLFWIHGGGFFAGAGTQQMYDSKYLSNRTNTVVVTVNYRLGALGFLAYEEDGVTFEGNQGHKDQQLALKWVNENIRSFGGDPDKVTIFGESAGGQAVTLHLLSSISEPYFQRAIIQSSPGYITYLNPKESEAVTDDLVSLLGCDGSTVVGCLRAKSAEEIARQHWNLTARARARGVDAMVALEPFRPVLDGREFPAQQPMQLFRAGAWNTDKGVITGATADEMGFDFVGWKTVGDAASFTNATIEYFGHENGPKIAEKYLRTVAGNENADYNKLFLDQLTDIYFLCPSILLSRFVSETSTSTMPASFHYVYDHPETSAPHCLDPATNATCGVASHGSELAYLFGTGELLGYDLKEEDAIVANQMHDYWGGFAHFGVPWARGSMISRWREFKPNENGNFWPSIRIKAPHSETELDYRRDYCEFLNSLELYVKNDDLHDVSYLEQLCRKVSMAFAFLVL